MSETVNGSYDYSERRERYAQLTDEELVDLFNQDVGNPGWTSSRATHSVALIRTFEDRDIDLGAIRSREGRYSWRSPISLNSLGVVELLPTEE